MIPVYQTIFGDPGGNCFAACAASLLEVPLETVPHFHLLHGFDWLPPYRNWLLSFRMAPICIIISGEANDADADYLFDCNIVGIAGGISNRGTSHACIYQGRNLIHDPHPQGSGLAKIDDLTFLVPLLVNPHERKNLSFHQT